MAERPVLRGHATFIREGIVCGNAAVGLQPDDLAQILAHVLRRVELLPLARGDEEILAVGRKGEAVREMTAPRSEEHTSELLSLMRISYAVFCLTKKN